MARSVFSPVTAFALQALAVARHEWRTLTSNHLILIFQAGFLFTLSALIFLVADFYSSDSASVAPLATFLPWVSLIFVPAIAMRMFSQENGDRQLEVLETLPISKGAIVVGKWLAGCAILLLVLALTFPFPLTVAYLGAPDWGRIFAVYLGCALLLTTFFAIALLAAAMLRDQIGAFVAALALLFVAIFLSWTSTANLIFGERASLVLDVLSTFSPKYWLDRIASGRIELAGIVYFLAAPALALWAAASLLEIRTNGFPSYARLGKGLSFGLVAIAIVSLAISSARRMDLAFDATDEREYSLHAATQAVIDRLPAGTVIDLYWTSQVTSVPASIREHARRIIGLLETLEARSGGRLKVIQHAPERESDDEFTALAGNVKLIPMTSGDSFMLGAIVRQGQRQATISYFDLTRDKLLEYDIALVLNGLGKTRVPRVAVLSPLVLPRHMKQDGSLAVIHELEKAYDLAILPVFSETLPDGYDAVVVIDATILKPQMLCSIDQHVMSGKGLVVLQDPYVRSTPQGNEVAPAPSTEINDITDLLLKWGLRYHPSEVIGDASLGTVVADASSRQFRYPFWLTLGPEQLSSSEGVSAGLHTLLFPEAGRFELLSPSAVPLVTTSKESGALGRDTFKNAAPEVQTGLFQQHNSGPWVVAAKVQGSLESAFNAPCQGSNGAAHIARSKSSARVFAVADVDWIFDNFAFQSLGTPDAPQRIPLNDNAAFFLNMVEAATGDEALVGIRSRGSTVRRFTKVESLIREKGEPNSARIRDLEKRIASVEDTIAKIPSASGVESFDQLPPALKPRVEQLRQELLPMRRELRDLRREMRETVETLGRRLTLANLSAGPIFALLELWLFGWLRKRRHKIRKDAVA
jgi:ABC-2 type transport system permease protein